MYIYDPQSTALRGLGVLYGLGKPPDVASRALQPAEVVQLVQEMTTLAQRNAWSGVDGIYKKLEHNKKTFDLIPKGLASAVTIHQWGAAASRDSGDTQNWRNRLWLAKTLLDTAVEGTNDSLLRPIIEDLENIDKNFGSVIIVPRSKSTSKKQRAQLKLTAVVLSTAPDPPTPDQLKSIAFAEQVIKETGSFTGLLPAGYYKLADESFTVENGPTAYTGKRPTNVLWGK